MNFVFNTFMQALRCILIDFVSSKVIDADRVEISSPGNEYFYSLFISVNETTSVSHLFHAINSPHQIILSMP